MKRLTENRAGSGHGRSGRVGGRTREAAQARWFRDEHPQVPRRDSGLIAQLFCEELSLRNTSLKVARSAAGLVVPGG
jgi:hypothetical protein